MFTALLGAATAHAWSLAPDAPIELPAPALDVAVADRYGIGAIVLVDGVRLAAYDADGALRAEQPSDAVALVLRREDADGYEDVVSCGPSGVAVARFALDFLPGGSVSSTPCRAIATHTYAGATGVVTVTDATIDVWNDAALAAFTGPESTPAVLGADPLVAAVDDRIAAVALHDDVLTEISAWGLSFLAAGGEVGGLAVFENEPIVALADRATLRSLSGSLVSLPGSPGAVAVGDLDADGLPDLVVLLDGGAVFVRTSADGGDRLLDVGAATDVAVGNLDADGCDDIVITDATTATLTEIYVRDCAIAADADHDGVAADLGDCDDLDALVYPGAAERCNGADDDCDGVADETTGLVVHAEEVIDEGSPYLAFVSVNGCDPGYTWVWSVPDLGEAVTCVAAGTELRCDARDDASGNFAVAAWPPADPVDTSAPDTDTGGTPATPVWSASWPLQVQNVAPVLLPPTDGLDDDLSDGFIVLEPGEETAGTFRAFDPGADALTFGSDGALDVSSSGAFLFRADAPGTWFATVWVQDDDGAADAHDLEIEVLQPDTGDEGGDPWGEDNVTCDNTGCDFDPCSGLSCLLPGFAAWPLLCRRLR